MHEYAFVGPRLPGFGKVVSCCFKGDEEDRLKNIKSEYQETSIEHSFEVKSMDDKEIETSENKY